MIRRNPYFDVFSVEASSERQDCGYPSQAILWPRQRSDGNRWMGQETC